MPTPPAMTKDDYLAVRNVIRWASVGAQPDVKRANEASQVLNSYKNSDFGLQLEPVGSVVDELRRGVLPSHSNCKVAEDALAQVYQRASVQDEQNLDTDRG
jgi:hypothetical protein